MDNNTAPSPAEGTVLHLDPNSLVVDENVRTDTAGYAELLVTLADDGVLQPLLGDRAPDGTLTIRDGQLRTFPRKWRCCVDASWRTRRHRRRDHRDGFIDVGTCEQEYGSAETPRRVAVPTLPKVVFSSGVWTSVSDCMDVGRRPGPTRARTITLARSVPRSGLTRTAPGTVPCAKRALVA